MNVAFFRNGILVDVSPFDKSKSLYENRDSAYHANVIYSDGVRFDLTNPDSVNALPIPAFQDGSETTSSMDYILRMCASNMRSSGNHSASIHVIKKATELMPHSGIGWALKDYLRIVAWLYEDGRIDEGDKVKSHITSSQLIKEKTDLTVVIKRNFEKIANRCDLIAFNLYSGECCDICAKYAGRVYCISGSHSNFPKLPDFLKECGCGHVCCNTGISAFWEGIDDSVYYRGKRIAISDADARPLVDDRSAQEIAAYEDRIKHLHEYENYLDRLREYQVLKVAIPNLMPRSLSAYTKMKNQNTKRFQTIVENAKDRGIEI